MYLYRVDILYTVYRLPVLQGNYWKSKFVLHITFFFKINVVCKLIILTQFWPIFTFCTHWKHQATLSPFKILKHYVLFCPKGSLSVFNIKFVTTLSWVIGAKTSFFETACLSYVSKINFVRDRLQILILISNEKKRIN